MSLWLSTDKGISDLLKESRYLFTNIRFANRMSQVRLASVQK